MYLESVGKKDKSKLIYITGSDDLLAINLSELLMRVQFRVQYYPLFRDLVKACEKEIPACLVVSSQTKDNAETAISLINEINNEIKPCPEIVLISDNNNIKNRLSAARAGVSRYFNKPLNPEKFVQTLTDLTDKLVSKPYRILFIDDDEIMLEFFASILNETDMDYRVLNDPMLGIKVLEEYRPDIIVMDIQMPDCLGSELAQIIRQDDEWAQVPIIFLSAESDFGKQLATMNLGGDFFIKKPVEVDHLLTAIRSRVKRSRKVHQLNHNLQNALRENKFHLVTMNQHDIVSSTDIAGRITSVNDRFCEISGYSRDELLGKNHRMLKSGYHADSFYKKIWRSISQGVIWRGSICNMNKNGNEYWVESTIVPFLDNKGIPYKYVSARTDITALRKSEERLKRSQLFANIGTWDWNISTGELYWSDRIWPLFGYEREVTETTYENFLAAVHPDDRNDVISAVNNCIENNSEYKIEHRVVWPDGSEHWVQESGDVVRCDEGNALHMLGVVQDIDERKISELALADRERELREAQKIARIGNWKANTVNNEAVWSDEMYRIFGCENYFIKPSFEYVKKTVHPDDLKQFEESVDKLLKTGRHDVVYRILLPDNSIRYVNELAETEKNELGELIAVVGTIQDVTDRIEAEKKLNETEERFSFAVEGAGDGVWDWDMQNNKMEFSKLLIEMLGYAEDDFIQHADTWFNRIHPDDLEDVKSNLQDYLQGKMSSYFIEYRLLCKEGGYTWVLCRGTIVSRDKDFNPLRMICIHSNITERVTLLESLNKQKSLVDRLHQSTTSFVEKADFNKAVDGMLKTALLLTDSDYGFMAELLCDEEGKQFIKTHAITNIEWNKVEDGNSKDNLNEFEFHDLDNLFGDAIVSREVVMSNEISKDPRFKGLPYGHPSVNSFIGVPVFYGSDLVGMYGLANSKKGYNQETVDFLSPFNITYGAMIHSRRMMDMEALNRSEIIEAKEEAENANRAKSQFLSSMSHELRTPLNAIMGFSQLLKMDDLSESQDDSVNEITKAGGHLLELINEVLDLAKIEAGRIELTMDSLIIEEVISESLLLVTPLAKNKNLNISLVKDGEDITFDQMTKQRSGVLADHSRLRQVLLNLLSNAVKYNSENGQLIVSYKQTEDNQIRISITDTGIGLTENQQNELFKSFNRLGAEQSEIEGSGIGLVITKNIVELMGGSIGVNSEKGTGSTFWIKLESTVLEDKLLASMIEDSELSENSEKINKKNTVLYIEDNPANLRLVNQLFSRRSNIHMWSAHEPLLGIELAIEHIPDLILLDINLPDMDGYEVLKQLKANEATRDIVVIAISANAMPCDIKKGYELGFDHYITKPINVSSLLEIVDSKLLMIDKS